MEYSRAEKILASLFVVFLIIASINFLRELEKVPARPNYDYYQAKYGIKPLLENQSRLMSLDRDLLKVYQALKKTLRKLRGFTPLRERSTGWRWKVEMQRRSLRLNT